VVLDIIAAMALLLPLVYVCVYFAMRWQSQWPMGTVAYPMGDRGRDPKANREAMERDLEVGRRQVRYIWRVWPVFAAMFLVEIGLTVYNIVS